MRPEQIRAELKTRGFAINSIAELLDVNQNTVSMVITRKGHSTRTEQAIATALDKPLHIVFPDRYQPPADWVEPEMVTISRKELGDMKTALAAAGKLIDRIMQAA